MRTCRQESTSGGVCTCREESTSGKRSIVSVFWGESTAGEVATTGEAKTSSEVQDEVNAHWNGKVSTNAEYF